MSAGVNRIAGRNNNKLDLNPEGSIEMSSVGSSITINSLITTSPNIIQPQTSIVLIPNPTSSITSSLETVSDIVPTIPIFFPTSSITGSTTSSILKEEEQFLPEEEYLFFVPSYLDIINVTDTTVINTDPTTDPISYYGSTGATTTVTNIKYDGTKIAASERDFYVDGVGYQSQSPLDWTCLIISVGLLFDWERKYGTNKTYGLTVRKDFPNLTPSGGGGKYLKPVGPTGGKQMLHGAIIADYPNYSQAERSEISDPFTAYKDFFRKVNKPIIIRIAGTGNRPKGHYVVMIGITKNGNIIVHDPANNIVYNKDQIITQERLLRVGEAENRINYNIFYIKK
jgi:hypothetical protein